MEWYFIIGVAVGFIAGVVFSWFNLRALILLMTPSTPKEKDKRKDADYWKPEDWTPDEP